MGRWRWRYFRTRCGIFFIHLSALLPDLGFGLIVASLIPEIKQDANEILHLWMIYFRVRDLDSMVS